MRTNLRFKIDFENISKNICESKVLHSKINGVKELIFAEDHRYLFHFGVDFIAMIRALYSTKVYKKFQGASTIEQQLVRVVSARYEKTLKRKIREQLLAVLISKKFKKLEIAQCYLINAYMGYRRVGVLEALKRSLVEPKTDELYYAAALLKYPHPMAVNDIWVEKINNRIAYIKRRELLHSNYLNSFN